MFLLTENAMGHHHHDHAAETTSGRRLFITMMLNFLITAVEIVGGVMSGSLSLLSDALHNFSDGLAIIISYIALRLKKKPKSPQYTFGLKRAEILAATINSAVLIAISLFLFAEVYHRFSEPHAIAGGLMMTVAGIGLAANVIGTLLLKKGAAGSLNIRSAYLHLLSDAVSSVAVILGGAAIYYWDIYWIDPVLTVLISLYILKESFGILRESVNVIMMGSPENVDLREIKKTVEAVDGVNNLHHVHLWRLNEHDIFMEGHVDVRDMPVSSASLILRELEKELHERFQISHLTLQFECNHCSAQNMV